MLITIRFDSADTLRDQISTQIRRDITSGRLQRSERLPNARDLAEQIGVNMNTVLDAYSSLRAEGLLEVHRGRGTRVHPAAPLIPRAFLVMVDDLMAEGRRLGIARSDIAQLLERS